MPTSRGRRRRRLQPPEVSDETFGRLRTLPRFLRSKVDEPAAAAAMRSVSDENTKCAGGRRPPPQAAAMGSVSDGNSMHAGER